MGKYDKFFALAKEAGLEQVELSISEFHSLNISLFHGEVDEYKDNNGYAIVARGILNGKCGSASCDVWNKDKAAWLVKEIVANAKVIENDDPIFIFKGSEKYHKVNTYNKDLEKVSIDEKMKNLYALEKALKGIDKRIVEVAGTEYSESTEKHTLVNSNGLNLVQKANYFTFVGQCVAKEGEQTKSGYDFFLGNKFEEFNPEEFAKKIVKLTGETKIVPKKGMEDKANPYPYLLFSSLFFIIEAIAVMVVFTLFKNSSNKALTDVAYFVLTVGAIGLVILVYNILPFRIDSITDGYRLTMVSNPKNRAAFNELLRVEYEIQQGNQDVEVKIFDEITNFTADLNLNKVYALLDKKEYSAAEEILDKIIAAKDGVDTKVYIRARAQKIYINLITRNLEEAKAYYDKEVPVSERREISNDVSMASIRAYLLMSGLLDKSRSECIIALNNVYRAFKHTPKNRQQTEITLFNEALDRVCKAHPDWELDGYKLQVAEK